MYPLRRLALRLGRARWLTTHADRVVAVELAVRRVSGGRVSVLGLAGLPELFLTVEERGTGRPRTTPLVAVASNGGWLVTTSNLGRPEPPPWVADLTAAGRAHVEYRGRHRTVTARTLAGEERDGAWAQLLRAWPPFATYAERAGRPLDVVFLAPTR